MERRRDADQHRREQDDDDREVPDEMTRRRSGAAKKRRDRPTRTRRTADVRAMSSRSISVLLSARDRSAPTAASARRPRANPNPPAPRRLARPSHRKTSGRCGSAPSCARFLAAPRQVDVSRALGLVAGVTLLFEDAEQRPDGGVARRIGKRLANLGGSRRALRVQDVENLAFSAGKGVGVCGHAKNIAPADYLALRSAEAQEFLSTDPALACDQIGRIC